MRKFIFLFLPLIVLPACSHIGHFTEPVEDLLLGWDETAEAARILSEKVTAEEIKISQLMDRLPPSKSTSGYIGENYLEEVDQLKAKLMGHKSAFDELTGEINSFLDRWDERTAEVEQLEASLSAGRLPRDVSDQVSDLGNFLKKGEEKMTAWTKDMNDIVAQCQKTEAAYRKALR